MKVERSKKERRKKSIGCFANDNEVNRGSKGVTSKGFEIDCFKCLLIGKWMAKWGRIHLMWLRIQTLFLSRLLSSHFVIELTSREARKKSLSMAWKMKSHQNTKVNLTCFFHVSFSRFLLCIRVPFDASPALRGLFYGNSLSMTEQR